MEYRDFVQFGVSDPACGNRCGDLYDTKEKSIQVKESSMKKVILLLAILTMGLPRANAQEYELASETTIDIARQFAKDLFELNGVPYLQPMVNAINATSNTGFFNTAYIPKQDTFYVKFSVHGMMGVVPDKYKTYTPQFPIEPLDLGKLNEYGDFDLINQSFDIQDTAGLIYYAFKTVLYDGVTKADSLGCQTRHQRFLVRWMLI